MILRLFRKGVSGMARKPTSRTFTVAVLGVAAIVTGFSIAQAVKEDSFEPLLTIAWLPAVILADTRRPVSGRRCLHRFLGRARS
jgi:hypothetical protein